MAGVMKSLISSQISSFSVSNHGVQRNPRSHRQTAVFSDFHNSYRRCTGDTTCSLSGLSTKKLLPPHAAPQSLNETLTFDLTLPGSKATLMSAPHPSQLDLPRLLRRELDRLGSGSAAQSAAAPVCNAADTLITCLLSPPQLRPAMDPRLHLHGNAFPVTETPPTPCSVVGSLPSDLNGAYIRNGPNATHLHNGEGFHFLDGDGMLHCVNIQQGAAIYCARYVKTSRFLQEAAVGRPLFPKLFGSLSGMLGIARTAVMLMRASLGLIDLSQGVGLSNTSVCLFKGQVLSMSEEDMPYVIKVTTSGDLLTQGRLELPGKSSMCAHPKFDPETGDMYAFSYPPSLPLFNLFKVEAENGKKSADVGVPDMFDLPIVHDFAITSKYLIFPDSELVARPLPFIRGEGVAVGDPHKKARFCVLPRDIFDRPKNASQEARWFEAPSSNCLHCVNAWDDDDSREIVLIAPIFSPLDKLLDLSGVSFMLNEIRLNIDTGNVTTREISCGRNMELSTMNERYVGRKSRYAYFAEGDSFPHGVSAVVKVDLELECIVARRTFTQGCRGGEPCFVSRHSLFHDNNNAHYKVELEDDGYLLCFVYNNSTQCSELLVMNALSPSLEVIASIKVPTRVPFGIHGSFFSDYKLGLQIPSD